MGALINVQIMAYRKSVALKTLLIITGDFRRAGCPYVVLQFVYWGKGNAGRLGGA